MINNKDNSGKPEDDPVSQSPEPPKTADNTKKDSKGRKKVSPPQFPVKPVYADLWELEPDHRPNLQLIIGALDYLIEGFTGHDWYNRKKLIYYAMATHLMNRFDPFPCLVFYGLISTGKSYTLRVMSKICKRPVPLTFEGTTFAAFKSAMHDAHFGTLVIEEAEKAKVVEDVMIARYSIASALFSKMVPVGGDNWERDEFKTYGATICHRRTQFDDPAMVRRTILIPTYHVDKDYKQYTEAPGLFAEFQKQMWLYHDIPDSKNRWRIHPGIFDCYRPLLAVTEYLEDMPFRAQLIAEMKEVSDGFHDEAMYQEVPSVIKVLVAGANQKLSREFTLDEISVSVVEWKQLVQYYFDADDLARKLTAQKRNRIIKKDLKFVYKNVGSETNFCFNVEQLVKRCDEYGIQDEVVEEWRIKIEEMKGG